MLILAAVASWVILAALIGWWFNRAEQAFLADVTPPQPDPIQKQVDKWMHDWERGRA